MAGRVSKYSEIASDLRAKIDNGTLGPGVQLPTEKELADSWGVSPNTIKKAVNELRQEGLVETVPQKGSFVAEPAAPFVITLNHTDLGEGNALGRGFGGGEGEAFVAEAQRQGHRTHSSKPEVQVEDADSAQMEALGINPVPPDSPQKPQVVRRSQERFVDGKPNSLQHSYFKLELAIQAQALLKSVDIEEGTVAYLQSRGHEQTGYEDEFDARPPRDEELRFFGLSRGSLAVIEHKRTAYDQNGEPFRLTITVYKPGTNKIRFIAGDVPDTVWQHDS
ncbi:DNA-binding transcriptional regulator, GntR family [Actinomadura madurae]|uniref:DNA-binding transcriptional regulator, GntR family n=1 Tax=Actinomadura madurae TaxID=1993 RepID=A0A1I4VWY0_9ACTN|nr:GntR family transcriptional regulator [Actinomadura madurae]SFN05741.1 DNA-binding transcriptional regulator, GntR family [Actinomadura madurae]